MAQYLNLAGVEALWGKIKGTFLPKSGGTLTGTLKIFRDAAAINYCSSTGTSHGWLGFSDANVPTVWMANGSTQYNLIHTGNIGSQSVNYANSAGSVGTAERLGKTWREDINYSSGSNLKIISNNTGTAGNFASGWQSGISVMSDYVGWQLTSYGGGEQNPYFRSLQDNGAWKPWRKLMFTDDNINWNQITNKPAVGIKNIFQLLANGSNNSAGSNGRNAYMELTPLNQDTYFFIKLSEDIAANEILVFSFDVFGVETEDFLWQWCWNNKSSEGMITITGNRRYYMRVTNKNAVTAGTNILIDDWAKDFNGQTTKIRLSNFKVSRGTECSDYIHNNDTMVLNNCDNTISGTITATGFYQSSDERLKTFHDPIKVDLDKLKKLRKNYFKFNDKDKLEIGVSAQEVQEIYPELVTSDDDGYLSVAYDKLSVIALAALDEQQKEIDDLKNQLSTIKDILKEKGIL